MAKCSQSHKFMLNYRIFGDIACRKANVWVLVFTWRGNGPFLDGQTMQIIEIQQSRPLARHQHIEHIRLERIQGNRDESHYKRGVCGGRAPHKLKSDVLKEVIVNLERFQILRGNFLISEAKHHTYCVQSHHQGTWKIESRDVEVINSRSVWISDNSMH